MVKQKRLKQFAKANVPLVRHAEWLTETHDASYCNEEQLNGVTTQLATGLPTTAWPEYLDMKWEANICQQTDSCEQLLLRRAEAAST